MFNLNFLFGNNKARQTKNGQKRKNNKLNSALGYETLEPRQLLACITGVTDGVGTYTAGGDTHQFQITSIANSRVHLTGSTATDTITISGFARNDNGGFGTFHSGGPEGLFVDVKAGSSDLNESFTSRTFNGDKTQWNFVLKLTATANSSASNMVVPGCHNLTYSIGIVGVGGTGGVPVSGISTRVLVNRNPVATSTSIIAFEDTVKTGALASTDADGHARTYSLVGSSNLSNGSINIQSDGNFTYTPDPTNPDNDTNTSFTYRVKDIDSAGIEFGGTDDQTVTITVNPVNDGPRYTDNISIKAPPTGLAEFIELIRRDPLERFDEVSDPEGDAFDLSKLEISIDKTTWVGVGTELDLGGGDKAELVFEGGTAQVKYTPVSGVEKVFFYRLKDDPTSGTAAFLTDQVRPSAEGNPRKITVTSILRPKFTSYIDNADLIQGEIPVNSAGTGFTRPFTNDARPVFNVTAEAGTDLSLIGLAGVAITRNMLTATTWEFTIDSRIPDENYEVRIDGVKDGIAASSDSFAFNVDTMAPTAPADLAIVNDTRTSVLAEGEPAHRANWDKDGVTSNVDKLMFTASAEPDDSPAKSGIWRYQILINGDIYRDTPSLNPGETVFDLMSNYPTIVEGTNLVHMRAIDEAGNVSDHSTPFWIEYDKTSPTLIGEFKSHEGAEETLKIELDANQDMSNILPIAVTSEQRPKINLTFVDQQFAVRHNQLTVRLFSEDSTGNRDLLTPLILSSNSQADPGDRVLFGPHKNTAQRTITLQPQTDLELNQDHTLVVQIADRAGNVLLDDSGAPVEPKITIHVTEQGDATLGAPSTPVNTDLFFLGAELLDAAPKDQKVIFVNQDLPVGLTVKISSETYEIVSSNKIGDTHRYELELSKNLASNLHEGTKVQMGKIGQQPWQMSFDKSTQTVWFTLQDGSRLGQFDPATGRTKIYDVSMNGDKSAAKPHGVFFDFNSNLTPRVWFVTRANKTQPVRVTYFDVEQSKLFSFNFENLTIEPGSEKRLREGHAVFVDALGDVWLTTHSIGKTGDSDGDPGALVQLNFDNGSLGSAVGEAIVHRFPEPEDSDNDFDFHGVQVVVDERDGSQYVYFFDGNELGDQSNDAVLGLLKPADPKDPDSKDQWFTWTIPEPENVPASRVGKPAHLLFTAIDDNETPGIPEDDKIVFTEPGFSHPKNGKGIHESIEVGNVIEAIQNQTQLPLTSPVHQLVVSKIPGSAGIASGANQTFLDRAGTVFSVDTQGAVVRFNFDDATEANTATAPVKSLGESTPLIGEIRMEEFEGFSSTPIIIETHRNNVVANDSHDRSSDDGVDMYKVVAAPTRESGGGGSFGYGPFRGSLNATNVLYGSISQSDHVSTTVFAETARRQMAVVKSPMTPLGNLEGRMAFQVLRDGSLRLTGRADGQILDTQVNLSKRIAGGADMPVLPKLSIYGEVSAVVDQENHVHVIGKQKFEGKVRLVVFKYTGSWNDQADLGDPANWSVKHLDAGNDLIVGDPTTYFDEQANEVRTLVTTNTGKLLLFEANRPTPVVLAVGSKINGKQVPVYSSVGIVHQGAWSFAYGTNQSGKLVEIGFKRDLTVASIKDSYIDVFEEKDFARRSDQTYRDLRVFQDVEAVLIGSTRHIYATDGNSRVVHFVVDRIRNVAWAENVSKIVNDEINKDNVAGTGYFPFQAEFVGRVYSGLEVLTNARGDQFVYGTNGGEVILLTKQGNADWRVANLTNDVFSASNDLPNNPTHRVSANNVFGSPAGYIEENGDRHLFQINKEGEVIEYYILAGEAIPRFHTQNIDFLNGKK